MARRRSRRKRSTRSGIGEYRWLIAAAILSLTAFFLKDAQGVPYRILGSYLWLIIFVITFFLAIFYLAQFILPLGWKESWFEGLILTLGYNFPLLSFVLGLGGRRGRRPSLSGQEKIVLPKEFHRHNAGLIPSSFAVVLSKGTIINRAAGPGFIRLGKREKISKIFDLRQHLEETRIEALTRDGIPVEGVLEVLLQTKQEVPPTDRSIPYPYEPDALYQLSYTDDQSESHILSAWRENILQLGGDLLISELSRFTLDELFRQDSSNGHSAFEQIQRSINSHLAAKFEPDGIDIMEVSLKNLIAPEVIVEQRIDNWQADWRRRNRIREAEGEAQIMQRLKIARARAQIEIIGNIATSIERMRQSSDVDLSDVVALRMVEAMEEAIAHDAVQSLVPPDTQTTLDQLERWLNKARGEDSLRGSELGEFE